MESPATITVFSKISGTSNNLLLDAAGRFTSQKTLSHKTRPHQDRHKLFTSFVVNCITYTLLNLCGHLL